MEKKRKASAMAVYPRPTTTCTAEDVSLKRAIGLGNRSALSSPGLEGPARFVDVAAVASGAKARAGARTPTAGLTGLLRRQYPAALEGQAVA